MKKHDRAEIAFKAILSNVGQALTLEPAPKVRRWLVQIGNIAREGVKGGD